MRRDFGQLEGSVFDVLVVGGGIYGAWTAYTASLAGFRVALIDKADWAGGTSSASTKLIHGGLRYLEQMHFRLVRTSLVERRRLTRLAPHQVFPVRFGLPVARGGRVGRWRLRAGLSLYDALGGRNQPVEGCRWLNRDAFAGRFPFLGTSGLAGGFTFGDCQVDDARFTIEVVSAAQAAGAITVNYAGVTEWVRENGRVSGAVVEDQVSGRCVEVRGAVVVNAGGAWVAGVGNGYPGAPRVRMTKGVHLVMPALPTNDGLLLLAGRDGRVFFMVPWYERTLLGTTDTDYEGDPNAVSVAGDDVAYLLAEANRYLRDRQWTEADVLGCFAGIRALQAGGNKAPSSVTREWTLVETESGMLASVGGKFTSARADAARIVARIGRLLGRAPGPDATADRPLPASPAGDFTAWWEIASRSCRSLGMDERCSRWVPRRYGQNTSALRTILSSRPALARPLVAGLPFVEAEVVHAVQHEMAVTLVDVLRRRLPVTILSRPDPRVAERAADLAAETLGWSAERRQRELEALWNAWTQPPP